MATLRVTCFALAATSLLASSAYAQNASKPLDLTLPPGSVSSSASATSFGNTAAGTDTASASTAPGVETTGATAASVVGNNPNDATDSCDASTDAKPKPQVHGSVGAGVVAGNHVSGNYQAATVNITQPLGDCKHPTGSLSITAHTSKSRFSYRGNH